MKKLSIAFALVLIAAFAFAAQAQTKKSSGIRSVDFRNLSYPFVYGDEEMTAKLRNGKFKLADVDGMVYVNKNDVAYGDVNGDGIEDAVVRLRLTTGASLRDFEIQAYTLEKGKAKLLARLNMDKATEGYEGCVCCSGERLKSRNGHVIFEVLTDGEIILSGKNITTFDYKLSGDKLILSGKPTKRPNKL